MNGWASRPSAATTKGTLSAIKPLMKWTSRLSRSSFATTTSHFNFFAAASAALSCGPRSSASEPLPLSISTNYLGDVEPFGFG
jgi:hypothetical protein